MNDIAQAERLNRKTPIAPSDMKAIDAIYERQSVRDYTAEKLDESTVFDLVNAAIHAPTAMDEEPWAFVIIQDKTLLNRMSDNAKKLMQSGFEANLTQGNKLQQEHFLVPEFNVFYNATTLIVICAKPVSDFVSADCWLAAQNILLAAAARKIGSCVIGLAVQILNTPKWKQELGIAEDMSVFVPIILGFPGKETSIKPRKPANILAWK